MQSDKVLSIESHDGSIVGSRQTEDGLVCERPSGLAHVGNGQDVVPESAQRFDYPQRKILVGEQARHGRLRRLVIADLHVDLIAMRTNVCPRVGKVFRSQRRIRTKQISFT